MREEIDADLGLDPFAAIPVSAKTGLGIEDLLAGIVQNLPAPKDDATFQANAKLMEKYKDRIEKSVNPAFDSFILASDSGDAFSRQMGALGHPQDDDKGE